MNMHIGSQKKIWKVNPLLWFCAVILIPAMMFYAPSKSRAQWSHIATHIFTGTPAPSGGALYFKGGVLWAGLHQILYSLDTGKTWNLSLNAMVGGETVMNFDFVNAMSGLCRTANHLYLTQDGGLTWSNQTTPGNSGSRYSIFAGSANIIISLAQDGIYVSNDGGGTWTKKYAGANPNIAAFKNGGTIAVYEAGAARLVVSHDFGQTWTAKPVDINIADSYSMEWDKCDPGLLYLTNEDFFAHNQNRSEVFGTANEGNTWVSLIQQSNGYLNGGMAISPTTAYFQSINDGILATTNKGVTWDSAFGPNNYPDTRWLAAVGSNYLMAVDKNGDVWQFGTGSMGMTPNFSRPKQLQITNCLPDTLHITLSGIRCRYFILRSAFITGHDSGFFMFRNQIPFPVNLTDVNIADFIIDFDSHHQIGSFTDSLHLVWEDAETGKRRDSVFILHADVSTTPTACIVSPQLLQFDTISPCRTGLDTLVKIINRGCDTASILNQPSQLGAGFSFDSLKLPVILPPDSSVTIAYHFRPVLPGTYQSSSVVIANDKGVLQTILISLNATASVSNFIGASINSQIEMDTVSSCDPNLDTAVTITNLGCVPMRLSQNSLLGNGFSINNIQYPLFIPSGSSVTFPIHFHPKSIGDYKQDLGFNADWNGFGMQKLQFHLHGVCSASKMGPLLSDTTVNFGVTSLCDPLRDTTIPLFNRSCDTLTILSGSGIIGTGFSASNLVFPIVLPPNTGMMITFHYLPVTQGSYQAKMKLMTLRGGKKQELSMFLLGNTTYSNAQLPLRDKNIDFGKITTCDQGRDTTIRFTNYACDTLNIISAPGILNNGFSMEPIALPFAIPPGRSMDVKFHFNGSGIGSFTTIPHFEFEREAVKNPLDIVLKCSVAPGKSIFSLRSPKIAFAPLSICENDSAMIAYTNSGCDTLYVTANGVVGDADFSAGVDNERALGHGDTIQIPVHFVPTLKGARSAFYNLHCRHRSGEIFDTAIAITGVVTDGTKILAAKLTQMDFGATRLCTSPDSTLLLTNQGCDTLVILAAQFAGTGFDLAGVVFPITILPGKSTVLQIHSVLDTVGKKSSSQASIAFTSSSDLPLAPITCSRSYIYPTNYPIRLQAVNNALKSGETFILRLLADSLPSDLLRLDAKLSVEHPDLLFLLSSQSKNTVLLHGDSLTILGNPVITPNSIIAELSYRVYLTKDSTTNIALSDIHFNPADDDYIKCMALSTSQSMAQFKYGFECGDLTLLMDMNGELTPKIFALRPNPAHGKIDLDLITLSNEDITINIIDAKGTSVLHELRNHPKGRSAVRIDISSFSSGAYFVNLDAGASHLTTTFVKEK